MQIGPDLAVREKPFFGSTECTGHPVGNLWLAKNRKRIRIELFLRPVRD
jgi:hypothetical protein